MTVKELYSLSSRLIYEAPYDDDDLMDSFPSILNQILAEATDYENQFRRLEGRTLLKVEDIPLYDDPKDERQLPFCEKLCRAALPLGVKAAFLEEDGGKQAEAVLAYNKYVSALADLTHAVFVEVECDDGADE